MPLNRRVATLLLAALALAACRESPRPAASAASGADRASAAAASPSDATAAAQPPSASAASHRLLVDGAASSDRPPLRFTLLAAAAPGADGILRLQAIEVRHAGSAELLQRLDGLDTQTPSTTVPVLEQIDLDFDGIPDVRVIEALPAGPNVPYRNWLYNRASGRFVASPQLDEVTSPVFDAERREVRSDWRDGATRYGTDTLAWRNGRLEPLRRVMFEAGQAGKAVQRTYTWTGSGWVLESTRDPRRP